MNNLLKKKKTNSPKVTFFDHLQNVCATKDDVRDDVFFAFLQKLQKINSGSYKSNNYTSRTAKSNNIIKIP